MARIEMYWDETGPSGEIATGIDVLSNLGVEAPPDACGFRLSRPDSRWTDYWYFRATSGGVLEKNTVTYDATYLRETSDAITARGPVHGCEGSGVYYFDTPLNSFIDGPNAPDIAGAGRFVAEFTRPGEIEWLDSAGAPIARPEVEFMDPVLPKDPFAPVPPVGIGVCIRDVDGNWHCQDSAGNHLPWQSSMGRALINRLRPRRWRAVRGAGSDMPYVARVTRIDAARPHLTDARRADAPKNRSKRVLAGRRSSTPKVVVPRSTLVVLSATFVKNPQHPELWVTYRFILPPYGRSTTFTTHITGDGPHRVEHVVRYPFPRVPASTTASAAASPASADLVAQQSPTGPGRPGKRRPALVGGSLTWLPQNERIITARVEVTNSADVITSGASRLRVVLQ